MQGLHKLREEREQIRPLSDWEEEIFSTIALWAERGVPDDAVSYPPPGEGRHTLPGDALKLAIDAIAKFVDKGKTCCSWTGNILDFVSRFYLWPHQPWRLAVAESPALHWDIYEGTKIIGICSCDL